MTTVPGFESIKILADDYPRYDLAFKLIVIGNSGVGKSCLSINATKNQFETNYLATVGFEFFSFNMDMDGQIVKLQIWDTCGQEIYRSLITNFYRNSSLAVIVYAINDRHSFESIESWIKELKMNASPDIKIFLIGNKSDLEEHREVQYSEGESLKNNYNLNEFMETSAKKGINTKELFLKAGVLLYNEHKNYKAKNPYPVPRVNPNIQRLKKNEQKNKSKCCKTG